MTPRPAPAPARPPDVLFVGVYKSGTKLLRAFFSSHPEISWSRQAQYFGSPRYGEDPSDYFRSCEAAGDCHVDMFEWLAAGVVDEGVEDWPSIYLTPGIETGSVPALAAIEEIARRIAETVPDGRILMVLRNQVDWLRSAYLHEIQALPSGDRSFAAFMNTLRGKFIARAGQYDMTIEAFRDRYGSERVHVMLLEELATSRDHVLGALCDFLRVGFVPFTEAPEDTNPGKGVGAGKAYQIAARAGLSPGLAQALKPFGRWLLEALPWSGGGDVLSEPEKDLLRAVYAVSNQRTARAIGRDLKPFGYPM